MALWSGAVSTSLITTNDAIIRNANILNTQTTARVGQLKKDRLTAIERDVAEFNRRMTSSAAAQSANYKRYSEAKIEKYAQLLSIRPKHLYQKLIKSGKFLGEVDDGDNEAFVCENTCTTEDIEDSVLKDVCDEAQRFGDNNTGKGAAKSCDTFWKDKPYYTIPSGQKLTPGGGSDLVTEYAQCTARLIHKNDNNMGNTQIDQKWEIETAGFSQAVNSTDYVPEYYWIWNPKTRNFSKRLGRSFKNFESHYFAYGRDPGLMIFSTLPGEEDCAQTAGEPIVLTYDENKFCNLPPVDSKLYSDYSPDSFQNKQLDDFAPLIDAFREYLVNLCYMAMGISALLFFLDFFQDICTYLMVTWGALRVNYVIEYELSVDKMVATSHDGQLRVAMDDGNLTGGKASDRKKHFKKMLTVRQLTGIKQQKKLFGFCKPKEANVRMKLFDDEEEEDTEIINGFLMNPALMEYDGSETEIEMVSMNVSMQLFDDDEVEITEIMRKDESNVVRICGDWRVIFDTTEKKEYYNNVVTGEVTWECPTECVEDTASESNVVRICGDWRVIFDTTEKIEYYNNVVTGEVTWECPTECVEDTASDIRSN